MKPLSLSEICSDKIEFLVAGRGVYRGFAGYHIVMLDRKLSRLVRLHWTPGHDLSVRFVDLDGDLPDDVSGASMAGHKIVLVDEDARVFGVNLNTGWTDKIWKFDGLVVLSPCGDCLIGATDRGLLTQFFVSLEPDAPLVPGGLQPLLVTGLDVFDMLVVPGNATDQFQLAIGCYGWVELVSLKNVERQSHEAIATENRAIKTDGLPFDPI
ncbi:MAG: hypothetical protein GY789_24465 [Hyphomicrobiales bacterium]|nr:hypothetical protein [Hyphomicrobiales bacterium]MCP5001438.1 hypothetical protein [Hyphomicrobiales bacterium]